MASNEYHFTDHWRIQGTVQEVDQILSDGAQFTRWWPDVYIKMQIVSQGDANGVGTDADAVVKGWLPYTLHLFFHTIETRHPYGFTMEVRGDFDGTGVWTFEQDGEWVNASYTWTIRADKPLLKYGSFLLRPLFASNHHWCMRKGRERIQAELNHRRLASQETRPMSAASLPG